MKKRNTIICLIIGYLGVMAGVLGVQTFNKNVLPSLPLWAKLVLLIFTYWVISLIPVILVFVSKERFADYGFGKAKLPIQILIGLFIGFTMSFVLTLIPHMTGLGEYVDNSNRYQHWWQYLFEFFYCIFAVGAVEEFCF